MLFDTLLIPHRLEYGLDSAARSGRMNCGRRDGFRPPRPGHKKHHGFLLSVPLGSFSWQASQPSHQEDTPGTGFIQLAGKPAVAPGRHSRDPAERSTGWRSKASHWQPCCGSWKWVLLPPTSHPMPLVLVNTLTALQERPGPESPLLSGSRFQTLRNHVR